MTIDGASGKVGIGTSSPTDMITVLPSSAGLSIVVRESDDGFEACSMEGYAGGGVLSVRNIHGHSRSADRSSMRDAVATDMSFDRYITCSAPGHNVDLLLGHIHLDVRPQQPTHLRQRLAGRQKSSVGPIMTALVVFALGESGALEVRLVHVGVIRRQPAATDAVYQNQLQR